MEKLKLYRCTRNTEKREKDSERKEKKERKIEGRFIKSIHKIYKSHLS